MKGVSAEMRPALIDFSAILQKLWEVALGTAEHEDIRLDDLRALAKDVLEFLQGTDSLAHALFMPAIARACVENDRVELSRELVKLFCHIWGSESLDKDLAREDKLAAFSSRHVDVPDEHFATVWNRPGMEHLKPKDRAQRLLRDLGSNSVENALRRVRRMVARGWDMAGYQKGPNGRARQIR